MQYRVTADIRYLDGTLEGITVPDGYAVTFKAYRSALSAWRWASKVQRSGDFVRAAVTGSRYRFAGAVRLTDEPELIL